MESDEKEIKAYLSKLFEKARKEDQEDPFSPTNYASKLPEGVTHHSINYHVHTKKFCDGLELRIVSTVKLDKGIHLLVCDRNEKDGWQDRAVREFPLHGNNDLRYIVETFQRYHRVHGNPESYESDIEEKTYQEIAQEIEDEGDDPYDGANYVRLLPEGVEQHLSFIALHTKTYADGTQVQVRTKEELESTIEVTVLERPHGKTWTTIETTQFPCDGNHDLRYLVNVFASYERRQKKQFRKAA